MDEQIINGFGYSTLNSLLLTIPMGFYGGSIMLLLSYLAYRIKNCRTWLIFGAQCGTVLASLLLWLLPLSAKGGLLFACTILPSIGGGYAVLMGLQIANTAGYTKRSIASSGLYIGYCLGESSLASSMMSAHFSMFVQAFLSNIGLSSPKQETLSDLCASRPQTPLGTQWAFWQWW